MKKVGYIALISILILQSGGLWVYFKCKQFEIQYRMFTSMHSDQLEYQKISLSISEYSKCKLNKREMNYQGKLYDIKSVEIHADQVDVLVVHDKEEEGIKERIEILFQKKGTQEKGFLTVLEKLSTLNYTCPETYFVLKPDRVKKNFINCSEGILTSEKEITTPPPKVI